MGIVFFAGLGPVVSVQVFLLGKLSQALILTHSGVLTGEILMSSLPIAGVAVIVLYAGMFIRKKIDTDSYRG